MLKQTRMYLCIRLQELKIYKCKLLMNVLESEESMKATEAKHKN
jgi:hypothetical protein